MNKSSCINLCFLFTEVNRCQASKNPFVFDIECSHLSSIIKLSNQLDSGSNNFIWLTNSFLTRGSEMRIANLALAGNLAYRLDSKVALYYGAIFVFNSRPSKKLLSEFLFVGLPGIEPGSYPPQGYILPLYYSPY